MLFNLYLSKKPKNQKPKNLHFKKPKNLMMPTMNIHIIIMLTYIYMYIYIIYY